VVGASVGEDLATSGNRVKGTFAGLIAGLAVSVFFGPSFLAVGLAAATTTLIALAFGWGVPVARIGVSVCIITLVFYAHEAVEYDLLRAVNTLIGAAVGLAVSLFVWPVRARDTLGPAADRTLAAAARLLDTLAAGAAELRPAQLALYDSIGALVKAGRDARVERDARLHDAAPDARVFQVLQLALEVLAATLAAQGHAPASPTLDVLRTRLAELARP